MTDEEKNETENKGNEQSKDINWSEVDASVIPQDVVKETASFKGLLGNQTLLRDQLRQQKEEIEGLKEQVDEFDKAADEGEDENDDGYITKAELKQRDKRQDEKRQKDTLVEARKERVAFEDESLRKAREKLTVETQGEDLDFDSVMEIGRDYMNREHPDECMAALASRRDPAGTLYKLYRSLVPELKQKDKALATSSALEKIKTGPTGKTGAGAVGGVDVSKMSDTQLDSELEKQIQ